MKTRILTMLCIIFASIAYLVVSQQVPDLKVDTSEQTPGVELLHVFEVVRHGARAPLIMTPKSKKKFVVGAQQLTPMGMRQRFFLGRYNYLKYGQKFDAVSKEGVNPYSPFLDRMHVQSTNVNRTIQSAYAEMFGYFLQRARSTKVNRRLNITEAQFDDIEKGGRGLPQFKIRRSKDIQQALNKSAIVKGFVTHPIYTFKDHNWLDDIKDTTCDYTAEIDHMLRYNDTTYEDVMFLRNDLQIQYRQYFQLSRNQTNQMTFHDAYNYADAVYSIRFHGYEKHAHWTSQELYKIETTQIYVLLLPCPGTARKLVISKLLEKPLLNILMIAMTNGSQELLDNINQYILYSAHDTQIANILRQITPGYNFTSIDYASSIYFEVFRQIETQEIFVRTMYNGVPLKIPGCHHNYDGSCEILQFLKGLEMRLHFGSLSIDHYLHYQCSKTIEPQLPPILYHQIKQELKKSTFFYQQ